MFRNLSIIDRDALPLYPSTAQRAGALRLRGKMVRLAQHLVMMGHNAAQSAMHMSCNPADLAL